jgi:hypothetical protein
MNILNLLDKLHGRFPVPRLTRGRIAAALAVAAVADFLQVALLPLEWLFVQQIVDVIAMGLTIWLLGFHLLLLPTFVIEFIPLVDMLPTWTGCVVAVVALRKRAGRPSAAGIPPVVSAPPSDTPPLQIGDGSPNQGTRPR